MPFRVKPFRDRLLNRLVKRVPLEELPAGAHPVRAGTPAAEVVLLREGHLHVALPGPDPLRRAVDLVLPWEVAGTEAILTGGAYRWDVVAPAPATIQRLPGPEFRAVLRRAEGTLDAFVLAHEERLALARLLGPAATGATAARRLALLLLHLARRSAERELRSTRPRDADPRRAGGRHPLEIPFRITHRTLGEMAGLHRSTVTTLLNDWLYRELLEDGEPGWRIPDPDALHRVTGTDGDTAAR